MLIPPITFIGMIEDIRKELGNYLNSERIPLMVLAIENENVIGVAQLKYREMDIYPEREHWLGGVFVEEAKRHRGAASAIVRKVISIAEELNVEVLHLQTVARDGGLYRKLGWKPVETVHYRNETVLVMEKNMAV